MTEDTLEIDPKSHAQSIAGFGGSLTESAAYVLQTLPEEKRIQVLRSYFDPTGGIGYTLARTPIGSCDFALSSWSLDDTPDDLAMQHFSLAPMRKFQLPLIQDARKIAGNGRFKLLASPWSPPAWMKTNGQMTQGGRLRPECAAAWAEYCVRFVKAMREEAGVPVWALTVQNEPDASQPWESCLYTPWQERDFIAKWLGPTLHRAGLDGVELYGWDHNRDGLEERATVMLGAPDCAKFLAGLAIHWYRAEDFAASRRVLQNYPATRILMTESSIEGGPHVDDWAAAERYARNIIGDMNNGVCGYIDWNIALDMQGGPNHAGNFCHAPVLVDTQAGEVRFQPSFHYIAHFSKYVLPGAARLLLRKGIGGLQVIAFANPGKDTVVVVCNPGDEARDYTLSVTGDARGCHLPAHAIQTHVVA